MYGYGLNFAHLIDILLFFSAVGGSIVLVITQLANIALESWGVAVVVTAVQNMKSSVPTSPINF